ncbi:MAG: HNH endonuclease [Thermoleophilia bacterium]|nr:HNH endonuclease [Thermoleophilia bacterium]
MYIDDKRVRLAAFDWLSAQERIYGDVLPRKILEQGFIIDGQRVPLISAQGIFKPKVLAEIPISITTSPKGPYDDQMGGNDLLSYRYRGIDPMHRDNVGLRKAMVEKTPLIYFFGLMPGKYVAVRPVFIAGDDPVNLTFDVAVDDRDLIGYYARKQTNAVADSSVDEGRRVYITAVVKQRLHQRGFRLKVLSAYHEQCALCRLKHAELLDAAHIIPDGEPGGEPVVTNGLALCKLHHAAFDNFFLGIRPDYMVEVRKDILAEEDGPMLQHGLKGLQGGKLIIPRALNARPSPGKLEIRYKQFLAS